MVRTLRLLGSLLFVLGLFTVAFVGVPWAIIVENDPLVPLWLRAAVFGVLGGLLLVLLAVALEQGIGGPGFSSERGTLYETRIVKRALIQDPNHE